MESKKKDDDDILLEEVNKISKSEFQQHFLEWIEKDSVSKALQSKLRKDLFDSFNKTKLGRKMELRYQSSHKMVLSPLILALNTLVAEFLYAQNCHFSLSVFSTEVPYRNTLPDFEIHDHFRFSQADLTEIFEAIAADDTTNSNLRSIISEQYLLGSTNISSSLLYCIFRNLFKKQKQNFSLKPMISSPPPINPPQSDSPQKPSELPKQKQDNECPKCQTTRKEIYTNAYNNQFRYLNKYLVILSKKVKEMSQNIEQLESKNTAAKQSSSIKSLKNRKIENLNRSLEKISENLKFLSQSKRKNKKFTLMISAVDKMAQQLEKCVGNFERIAENITAQNQQSQKKVMIDTQTEKSYSDWIKEMRSTKSGKKFLTKIESSLRKTLSKEKDKLQKIFDNKLENEKALIKLKYKQKFLEEIRNHHKGTQNCEGVKKTKEVSDIIEIKLKNLELKQKELQEKVAEVEEKSINNVVTTPNISEPEKKYISTPKVFRNDIITKIQQPHPNIQHQSVQAMPPNVYATESSPTTSKKTILGFASNFKPELEEFTKKIVEKERNIEHIVFDAKFRVQELEFESNQLEKSFQDYLDKRRFEKDRIDSGLTKILEKYNIEKFILNKKLTDERTNTKIKINSTASPSECSKYLNKNDILIENTASDEDKPFSENIQNILSTKIPTFENPFRILQDEILVKKIWKKQTEDKETQIKPTFKRQKSTAPKIFESEEIIEEETMPYYDPTILIQESPSLEISNNNNQSNLKEHIINNIVNIIPTVEVTKNVEVDIDMNISPALSRISSEINLKDATLEGIEVSDSKSSSNEKSYNENIRSVKNVISINTDKRKSLTKSAQINYENKASTSNTFNKIQLSNNINLQLPPKDSVQEKLSSSNSSTQSERAQLSIGNQDLSPGYDFWDI